VTSPTVDSLFAADAPAVGLRVVHLDLKGVPPTFEHLLELLEVFAHCRYNAVLVEWEDMFPWTVDERFRCATAYTPDQVRRFNEEADRLGLEVIPLVQCLGHLEWILRTPGLEHLRETPEGPDVIHPLAEGAGERIAALVEDVLSLTADARRFHLGGDEAWSFGAHPDSKAFIAEHGKGALYLKHIEPLLDRLDARGIRPLLWHDMMVDWDSEDLHRLAARADLVAWGYCGHPDEIEGHWKTDNVLRLADHGFSLWGGCAYKGADGQSADLPDPAVRERNALGWMDLHERVGFVGVVATAWSRYSGHRLQNEPIDGALDSLLDIGVVLHDAHPPVAGGIDACRAALAGLGIGGTFRACRDALQALTDARRFAWQVVMEIHEQLHLARLDPARADTAAHNGHHHRFGEARAKLDEADHAVRGALAGLVPDVWIEEYLATRIGAFRDAEAHLLERMDEARRS
jgi:hypothetical protein